MQKVLLMLMIAFAPAASATAAPAMPGSRPMPNLGTILVQGNQPGPGMWRVSRGDHTLWILGTLRPLPAGIAWQSKDVEAVIAGSQEVLGVGRAVPRISLGTMFKMASLAPSALRFQHNPDNHSLREVVGPALHARWAVARNKYAPAPSGTQLETLRPLYASQQLYWRAVDAAGLATTDVVTPVVTSTAKRAGVPVTDTGFRFPLELDRKQLKRHLSALNHAAGGDLACFEETLNVIDTDLVTMKQRANAWASGDVGALRALTRGDPGPPCQEVDEAAMAFMGGGETKRKLRAAWLQAAQASLSRNRRTFASLPISQLIAGDGVLADLRKRGYRVEAPDDEEADGSAD